MLVAGLLFALTPFGHDHYISRDGGWCWFADPRAIWVDKKILAGGVTQNGDVTVHLYDPATKQEKTAVLWSKFEKDDHDNPSFLALPDKRILTFFSKHSGPDMWMAEANASDPLNWSKPVAISPNDKAYKGPKGSLNGYCYPNPQLLSGEKNRIYLFWRGMNWKPTLSWSDDLGKTWQKGRQVVSPVSDDPNNRPYVKVAGNGKDRIHFVFTDGHPRNEPTNSIYYARYEKGAFRGVDGKPIAKLNQLPFRPGDADVIYDGKAEGVRAWVWDVSEDAKGNPIVVYTRLPQEDRHLYRYARWNGKRWVDRPIVDGGKWFPQTPEGKKEPEPHYSGGLCLDANDPRFVYVSRPINGRFEIERWFTDDGGDSWSHVALSGYSKHDSIRPFVVRGQRPATGPVAVWVNAHRYVHYTDYGSTQQGADEDRGPFPANDPKRAAKAVWQWARSNMFSHSITDWTMAPLYTGVLDYADLMGDDQAREWVREIARKAEWKLGRRPFMADDHAVGQAYLQLYALDKEPVQLGAVKAMADAVMARPHTESLEFKNGVGDREWAWCDSLYMAPPVLAALAKTTGDHQYLELLDRLWWRTSDYLYDPTEKLYFRDSRYFKSKEANGKKVFWARGNGWVLAGLARVMKEIPKSDPLRAKFEDQFKAMAARVASLQTADGTWHSSLLDPESYPSPETSGTGFYCYALAWGIRDGLLDRATFKPVVDKAFSALCRFVDPSGRLGWVQPIGQDPKHVSPNDTESYGVGAFLQAAAAVYQLSGGRGQ